MEEYVINRPLIDFNAYINAIIDSIDSKAYRQYFVEIDGKMVDILEDGQLSCSRHTSNIILPFALVKERHCTVRGLIRDMIIDSGWYLIPIERRKIGAILLWEPELHPSGRTTEHIGFLVWDGLAISHRDDTRTPRIHHWTYGIKKYGSPVRRVKAIYWHDRLG
jgi:hypothetical protein